MTGIPNTEKKVTFLNLFYRLNDPIFGSNLTDLFFIYKIVKEVYIAKAFIRRTKCDKLN